MAVCRAQRRAAEYEKGDEMHSKLDGVVLTCAFVFLFCTTGFAEMSEITLDLCADDERCRERQEQVLLLKIVEEAKAMVEERGEEVFVEFQRPGSVWNNGQGPDFFVVDTEGIFIVHPSPEYVGKDGLEMKELNGKLFVRRRIEQSEAEKKSWIRRLWGKIKGFRIIRESYVVVAVAPSGNDYVIGSSLGISNMARSIVERLVDKACALVKEKGAAAFPIFREPTSEFRFKNTYVFVLTEDGTILVEPSFPQLEGKDLNNMDPQYAALLRGPITLMRSLEKVEDSGWEIYDWYKPDGKEITTKASFGKKVRVGGKTYIVGTGVYLND